MENNLSTTNNIAMDIYRRNNPNNTVLTQKEKSALTENGFLHKTFTGRGTNEQRANCWRYLNEQAALYMRPALCNKTIQENCSKANKGYNKARRNYLKAGFTIFFKEANESNW